MSVPADIAPNAPADPTPHCGHCGMRADPDHLAILLDKIDEAPADTIGHVLSIASGAAAIGARGRIDRSVGEALAVAPVACTECGGNGTGPDRVDGPGDVYQLPCEHCDGKGLEPEALAVAPTEPPGVAPVDPRVAADIAIYKLRAAAFAVKALGGVDYPFVDIAHRSPSACALLVSAGGEERKSRGGSPRFVCVDLVVDGVQFQAFREWTAEELLADIDARAKAL